MGCRVVSVGEIASSISEPFDFKKNTSIVLVNTGDVDTGVVLSHQKLLHAEVKGQFKKSFQKDDILYSEIRPRNGHYAFIDFDASEYVASTKLMVIRADHAVIRPRFLYVFLTSAKTVTQLQAAAESRSGTFPQITFDEVARLTIDLPPLEEQDRILAVHSTIEAKIALNAKLNGYLEELADSLFKRRFGELPDNASLSDVVEITMGQSPAGSSYNEDGVGTVFYQGRAEFGWRYPSQRLSTTEPKRIARRGDVLMSVRAPVGDLNIAFEDCCIGRGLAAIHSEHPSFCLYLMRSLHSKLDAFNGEGTVFGSINGRALKSLPIALPETREIQTFEKEVSPIDTQIRGNELQSRLLVTLRDTLLPRLMSGEIDVSKVTLF